MNTIFELKEELVEQIRALFVNKRALTWVKQKKNNLVIMNRISTAKILQMVIPTTKSYYNAPHGIFRDEEDARITAKIK